MNPYKVSWIVLAPIKGIATKKDSQIASNIVSGWRRYFARSIDNKLMFAHSPSQEDALLCVKLLNSKLSKKYTAYIITDKQFGCAKRVEDMLDVVTLKQKKESIII